MAGSQIAAPSHLSFRLQGQGLQSVQMMNINRNSKTEDILEEYKTLRDEDAFTDLEIVAGGYRGAQLCRRKIHSVVMAASSDFLGHWMEQVLPLPAYTIVLPDVGGEELDAVISILYGSALTVSPALAPKIHTLADMLGIAVDLPFRTSGVPDNIDSTAHLRPPPVCCWHCNIPFGSVGELQSHLQTHQGERFSRKKKLHKCKRCDKVLPNMWKFRQHLLSHELELAVPTARSPPPPVVRQPLPESQPTFQVQQPQKENSEQDELQEQSEEQHDPIQPVAKDHSYWSKTGQVSSQDPTSLRMDHLYSVQGIATPPAPSTASFMQPRQEDAKPRSLRKRSGSAAAAAVTVGVKKRVQVLLPVKEEERQKVLFSTHTLSAAASASASVTGSRAQLEVKSDHAYSSAPPSPLRTQDPLATPESSSASTSKKPTAAKTKKKKKRGPSIQALGHSYAAARPVRKCSEQNPHGWGGEQEMYPCDQCEKIFPQPYRLNRHIREVHLKDKKYFCSICDKGFFKVTSRERHEMTHTEHSRWKCGVCEKLFGDQSSLRYHERNRVCTKRTRSSATSAPLP